MEKKEAIEILDELEAVIKSWCEKKKLRYVAGRGTYNTTEGKVTLRASVHKPVSVKEQAKKQKALTQVDVNAGLAPINTIAWAPYEGDYWLVRILESRKSRYAFEWVGYEEEYGQYNGPFRGFLLKHPMTGQPADETAE